MLIDTYAKQLGFDLGMEIPRDPTEEGGYLLELKPGIRVEIRQEGAGFSMVSDVGVVAKSEERIEEMMLANLLGQGTGGAVLGLDKQGREARLRKEMPWEMTYVEFKEAVEAFFNFAEYWKMKIS